jgi:hypothetical protein
LFMITGGQTLRRGESNQGRCCIVQIEAL